MVSVSEFSSPDRDLFASPADSFLPREVLVPLDSGGGGPLDILVRAGDSVREGEMIAASRDSCAHSSVPGVVKEIADFERADGRRGKCARIAVSGAFTFTGKMAEERDWAGLDQEQLCRLLKDGGVVNTFGKPEPLFAQIRSRRRKERPVLAVRLFDDDPSREIENFLARQYRRRVVEGAGVVAKAMGAAAVVLAFDRKDRSMPGRACGALADRLGPGTAVFAVPVDARAYPCGTKHDIVSGAKRAFGDDALSKFGRDDFFIDANTALGAHRAVVNGIPSIFGFVHVTGGCLNAAAIMKVRVGTPIREIVPQCGNFKRPLGKIVINGILCGHAVPSLDVPVSRGVKSIEFLPRRAVPVDTAVTCVRCGNCRAVCPSRLRPERLYRLCRDGAGDGGTLKTALLCLECGLCNAVCPSRIPLCQCIATLKENGRSQKR